MQVYSVGWWVRLWSGRRLYPCLTDRRTPFPCCMQTLVSHLLSIKEQVVANEGLFKCSQDEKPPQGISVEGYEAGGQTIFSVHLGASYESSLFSLMSLTANLSLALFFINKSK